MEEKGVGRSLGENFHVRGDGTRAFFFTQSFLEELFVAAGFRVIAMEVVEREAQFTKGRNSFSSVEGEHKPMRQFLQAKFERIE